MLFLKIGCNLIVRFIKNVNRYFFLGFNENVSESYDQIDNEDNETDGIYNDIISPDLFNVFI